MTGPTLCATARCRIHARHEPGCVVEPCRGCQRRQAADGLRLCQVHTDRIGPDATTLAELHDELAHSVMPSGSGSGEPGRGGSDGPPVPRDRVVAIRTEIRHTLVSWCRLVSEERGVRLPRQTAERRTGVVGTPDLAEPSCGVLAAYVVTHAVWLAAQDFADEVSDELDSLRRRAWSVAYPNGTRVVEVGLCPGEQPVEMGDGRIGLRWCEGTLRAIVRPAETLLPSEVVCDVDPEHRWDSTQWRQLDRLVSGRRAA